MCEGKNQLAHNRWERRCTHTHRHRIDLSSRSKRRFAFVSFCFDHYKTINQLAGIWIGGWTECERYFVHVALSTLTPNHRYVFADFVEFAVHQRNDEKPNGKNGKGQLFNKTNSIELIQNQIFLCRYVFFNFCEAEREWVRFAFEFSNW